MIYTLAFRGEKHILNATTGTLTGVLADELCRLVDKSIGHTTGGHPSSSFDGVKITTPYQDIEQFAMSLAEALPMDFPKELGVFVKIYKIDTDVPFEVLY